LQAEPTDVAFFEVAPDDDAAFLAAWSGSGTLYRALRRDVRFRFVAIGGADGYEIVREDGTVDIDGGVLRIVPFELPAAGDDVFLAGWERAHAVLERQRGYLGTRLYRGERSFRFVDVVRWSSPLMIARALALPELEAVPFPSHPAVYSLAAG
jgi:hypothetical protein